MIVLKKIFKKINASKRVCSRRKRVVWWINIRIEEKRKNDFQPIFWMISSSFSSIILCGIVNLEMKLLDTAKIRHAVECIPKFPEKTSISNPKTKAYISKYHLGILKGIIIKSIMYKNGFIYDPIKTSFKT